MRWRCRTTCATLPRKPPCPTPVQIQHALNLRVAAIGVDALEVDQAAGVHVWYGDDNTIYFSYTRAWRLSRSPLRRSRLVLPL